MRMNLTSTQLSAVHAEHQLVDEHSSGLEAAEPLHQDDAHHHHQE
jgi:hypothetical protein